MGVMFFDKRASAAQIGISLPLPVLLAIQVHARAYSLK